MSIVSMEINIMLNFYHLKIKNSRNYQQSQAIICYIDSNVI
jgi:hypothetical protein